MVVKIVRVVAAVSFDVQDRISKSKRQLSINYTRDHGSSFSTTEELQLSRMFRRLAEFHNVEYINQSTLLVHIIRWFSGKSVAEAPFS